MTEKKIDQIINKQLVSETFWKTNTLAHSHRELCCTDLESYFVDQNKEGPVDNPICLIGSINYICDSPNFDLSSDDAPQTEVNLAGPSLVDLWEEDQFLQRSNEPIQTIYDTDEESYESWGVSKDSLDIFSASSQIMSNSFYVIGNQQTFSSKVEEESNEEIFEQVETKEPSLEKQEAMEQTPTQEDIYLYTELSPLNQNISELQEDDIAIYDESSSSDYNEDEEVFLSQEDIYLDPVEKEEISLLFDLQVKYDDASKQHTEDIVLKANVLEADNLPTMEG